MAIRHKRKNSAGYTWQAGDLVEGQIGLNIADGTLHFDKADGSTVTIAPGAITDVIQDTTPQLGGNLDVNGNKIVSTSNGNIAIEPNGTGIVTVNKNIETTGDVKAKELWSTNSIGNEGGQINLATPATNSSLSGGNVVIDINQNQFRIFEMGGNNRGVYIDIGSAATGVGTNLLSGGGITDVVQDTAPQLGGNLDVNGFSIVTAAASNASITIAPDGTGDVNLDTDIVRVGDLNTNATITTNGTGHLTLNTNNSGSGASITINTGINGNITLAPAGTGDVFVDADTLRVGDLNTNATITTNGTSSLTLNTNSGTNSGSIFIAQGLNGNISITPNGTGDVLLQADTVQVGDINTAATLTTNGTGNLILNTNNGTSSGNITINQGLNGNIVLAPNGTGDVQVDADTLRVGDANAAATITSNGTGNLILNTNNGTSSGNITINQGANANIQITPNGTGNIGLQAFTTVVGTTNSAATVTSNGTGNLTLSTNNGTNSGTIVINQGANANIDITPNGTGRVGLLSSTIGIGSFSNPATVSTVGAGNLTLSTNNGTNSGTVVINQGANANIQITPNGTGQTRISNIQYNEAVFNYGNSGLLTWTPDAANGNVQTITLTGNLTLNAFANPVSGQTITFIITQDATGGRTMTSTMRFAGGSKTLSTAANAIDILTVSYIGTTYYATLSKGYA